MPIKIPTVANVNFAAVRNARPIRPTSKHQHNQHVAPTGFGADFAVAALAECSAADSDFFTRFLTSAMMGLQQLL